MFQRTAALHEAFINIIAPQERQMFKKITIEDMLLLFYPNIYLSKAWAELLIVILVNKPHKPEALPERVVCFLKLIEWDAQDHKRLMSVWLRPATVVMKTYNLRGH